MVSVLFIEHLFVRLSECLYFMDSGYPWLPFGKANMPIATFSPEVLAGIDSFTLLCIPRLYLAWGG